MYRAGKQCLCVQYLPVDEEGDEEIAELGYKQEFISQVDALLI